MAPPTAMRQGVYEHVLGQLLGAMGLSLGPMGAIASVGCGSTEDGEGYEQPSPQECTSPPPAGSTRLCDAQEIGADEATRRVCIAPLMDGSCESCDADGVRIDAEDQVGSICGFTSLHEVACGPVEQNGMCCYDVVYGVDESDPCFEETTAGRPFWVDGKARLAVLSELSDASAWAMAMEVSLRELGDAQRVVLAQEWTRDALDEHASIPAFARHVMELMALGAPPELVSAAAAAMSDEVEHARLCFGLASAYAGRPVGPGEIAVDGAIPAAVDEAQVVRGLVREGCIGETLAAIVAGRARDATREPIVAAVLDTIAQDEARHAALAWKTLRWLVERARARGDRQLVATARIAFARGLRSVRDAGTLESSALRRHGRLSSTERRMIVEAAVDRVLAPTAAALFESEASVDLGAMRA